MKLPIYLDHHATTPMDERVLDAMLPYMREHFGNASSREHAFGWRAEEAVERARAQVASLLDAEPREIVFTSGATEANNLALTGIAQAYASKGRHIITQATEHPAVLDVCRALEKKGYSLTVLPVDHQGVVDLESLKAALRDDTCLVSIMAANNEVGTLQDVNAASALVKEHGAIFHSDMVQAMGRIPLSLKSNAVGAASFSGHKVYGPKGVGALYLSRRNPRVNLVPLFHGGSHERAIRPGTLNVPGIVGLGEACAVAEERLEKDAERIRGLRDRLIQHVLGGLGDACVLYGSTENRLPGNISLGFEGVEDERLILSLGELALSSGAACTSHTKEPSHVLAAMLGEKAGTRATLRIGIGRYNSIDEVDYAGAKIVEVAKGLRGLGS